MRRAVSRLGPHRLDQRSDPGRSGGSGHGLRPAGPARPLARLPWGSARRGSDGRSSHCWRDPLSRICSDTSSGAASWRRLARGNPPGVADLRTALQDALGPTYRVEREVRPVGTCRMFVALEGASGPALLVKVLPGELSLALDTALLERELLLLAERLSAPPLVPPRGSGRAGPFVYHSRAFVEGTTLRAWLTRNGEDRKSTRLNSSHSQISYAVFCLKKKK